MFQDYRECDSDSVLVNLFAERAGAAFAVRAPVGSASVGQFWFTPHMLHHLRAPDLLLLGVGVDVRARLLTHRYSTTTSQTPSTSMSMSRAPS
jgi:integrase